MNPDAWDQAHYNQYCALNVVIGVLQFTCTLVESWQAQNWFSALVRTGKVLHSMIEGLPQQFCDQSGGGSRDIHLIFRRNNVWRMVPHMWPAWAWVKFIQCPKKWRKKKSLEDCLKDRFKKYIQSCVWKPFRHKQFQAWFPKWTVEYLTRKLLKDSAVPSLIWGMYHKDRG